MSSGVQNLLDSTIGDGARPSKFEVYFTFRDPNTGISENDIVFLGKTSAFPGKQHTPIDFKYKGRKIPIKGQVKYSHVWDCSFYLTADHKLKYVFDNWIESLDDIHYSTSTSKGLSDAIVAHRNNYVTDITIMQIDFDGTKGLAKYVIHNAFPTVISTSAVSYESTGSILDFTVSFSFSHYTMEIMKGGHGNFIDDMVSKLQSLSQQAVNNFMGNTAGAVNNVANSLLDLGSQSSSRQGAIHGASTEGNALSTPTPNSTNNGNMLTNNSFLSGFGL